MNDRQAMQGTVRITLPAKVASDLPSFQRSLAVLAKRLGCPTCFSGFNCTFQLERDFVINDRMEMSTVSSPLPQDPVPERHVTATLASGVSHDLAKIQETVARIARKLGCGACCSGFDITLRMGQG
jgi:hypothetical protein